MIRRALSLLALVAATAARAQSAIPSVDTPGAIDQAVTQANIHQTICAPGYSGNVRPPSYYAARGSTSNNCALNFIG